MGKQVTVKPGYTYVTLPGQYGPAQYNGGETVTFTDAEYAALTASQLSWLGTSSNVAEPVRPKSDTAGKATTTVNYTTGTQTFTAGQAYVVNLGANMSAPAFTGFTAGTLSHINVIYVQDATGSRTLAAGSVSKSPTLTTTANKKDYVNYTSWDGGSTVVCTLVVANI